MGKNISATALRSQLSTLLDQLKAGETHFVIERNNQPEAVLLNIHKFQEIMQMLEVINRLEFISPESLEVETVLSDLDKADFSAEFDDIFINEPDMYANVNAAHANGRTASSQAIEDAAARLGIRLIK